MKKIASLLFVVATVIGINATPAKAAGFAGCIGNSFFVVNVPRRVSAQIWSNATCMPQGSVVVYPARALPVGWKITSVQIIIQYQRSWNPVVTFYEYNRLIWDGGTTVTAATPYRPGKWFTYVQTDHGSFNSGSSNF